MQNLLEESHTYGKGLPKRMNINGITKDYETYRIPIEKLFYNDMNGRISTYIEEYDANSSNDTKLELLFKNDINKFNEIIAGFIKQSSDDNEVSFNKTCNDICDKGQQIPGVVLSDGRIIDGNRRFTCIRELFANKGDVKFAYFEAAILPVPETKENWRDIKLLELNLQFDVDEKRDYNKIDFLVSFYKDAMSKNDESKIDKNTYCHASGMSGSDFNANVNIVETMLDYLKWRNMPTSFYILKKEKLDGPIEDVAKKKVKMSEEDWNNKKFAIYSYITIVDVGDRTRQIRKLMNSAKSDGVLFECFDKGISDDGYNIKIIDVINEMNKTPDSVEQSNKFQDDKQAVMERMSKIFADAEFKESVKEGKDGPYKALDSATNSLDCIDVDFLKTFNADEKFKLNESIKNLYEILKKLDDATK